MRFENAWIGGLGGTVVYKKLDGTQEVLVDVAVVQLVPLNE
ncbi:MAG TPA: hypothetical protein VKX49_17705 [Bryobacteraceae bacterium]|nr:hypothetical protein [Bryobacteraceae bacterium]